MPDPCDCVAGFVSVGPDGDILLTSCLDGIHACYTLPAYVQRYRFWKLEDTSGKLFARIRICIIQPDPECVLSRPGQCCGAETAWSRAFLTRGLNFCYSFLYQLRRVQLDS